MQLTPITIFLVISLQACERKISLNESAIRSWAPSSKVVSRTSPSCYIHNERGRYVAVGAGSFIETPDGKIDLDSKAALPEGFYVFPGKIWVRTIDEAIRTMRTIKPGTIKPKAEQDGGGQPATRPESK